MNTTPHLTTKSLAERWTMHEESIRRLFRDRKLPGAFKIGRQIRIAVADVERIENATRLVMEMSQ